VCRQLSCLGNCLAGPCVADVYSYNVLLLLLQVWKDVDGVLTSDPRIVSNTIPVTELTYEEATELAFFGAQVGGGCCYRCSISTEAASSRNYATFSSQGGSL
jgi:uridylate kinase